MPTVIPTIHFRSWAKTLGQTTRGSANGENRNSVPAEEKDERAESNSKPTSSVVDDPAVNREKTTTKEAPNGSKSTSAADPETPADSEADATQPAEPEERKDEPSAPTSPKGPSEDPEDVRAREEIGRLNAELMQVAAEEESESTPAHANEHPVADQTQESPPEAETKAQEANGEAAEPEILEPKDVSASAEENTEHTKPAEATENEGAPEVSEATPVEAQNAEAEIPVDQMIEKEEVSDIPKENIPETAIETNPIESDKLPAPGLAKEEATESPELHSAQKAESTSPATKESDGNRNPHIESKDDLTYEGPIVMESAPLPKAPIEDPEDFKARAEIARLNAELLAAAAEEELAIDKGIDGIASPNAPEMNASHEEVVDIKELTPEQPLEPTLTPAESSADLDPTSQSETREASTKIPSEEMGLDKHSATTDESHEAVTEVIEETAYEPVVEAQISGVEDHPIKGEAVNTKDSTASHAPEGAIAGRKRTIGTRGSCF
jgi:hypothetical protein